MTEILNELEVAALLDCQPSTVATLARDRQLPGVQFGRSWRFPRTALLEVINRMAMNHVDIEPTKKTAAVSLVTPARKAPPALPVTHLN